MEKEFKKISRAQNSQSQGNLIVNLDQDER